MSLIRVCAITSDLYPQDPTVRRAAEAAASAGYEYHVICSMGPEQQQYDVINGVHVHRICLNSGEGKPLGKISGRRLDEMLVLWTLFGGRAFSKIARLHFKFKFHVVHVHNLPDYLVFAALIPKWLGARVILHVQDVSPELMAVKSKGVARKVTVALAKLQERASTAFADHVLTVGWPFEAPLLKRGVRQQKLSSILNSADPNIFIPEKRTDPFLGQPTAERPLVLMYSGTCAERNGLDTAIRAVAKAKSAAPHLRFHLRGDGEFLPYCKQLVQTLGLTDHVFFFPYGSLESLADFVADGDVGIIPYRSDGFMDLVLPTKAYEFALMRRPMIASNTVALRSMFRPGSLTLCEPCNVDSFADAIIELYWHPEKRAAQVAAAERDYAEYRWEIMAERYCQLISSLTRSSTPQGEVKRSVGAIN